MKYLSITRINPFTLFIPLLFLSSGILAQKYTDSPYSRYGIGLLNNTSFNGNFGMSGAGYAWRPYQYKPLIYDSLSRSSANLNDRGTNYINPKNPASYSNISLTTFEAGLLSRNVEYTSNGQSRVGSNTQLSHMSLAFPLGEKWGMGFGIKPYSSIGYDYETRDAVNGNDLTYIFEGNGGLNQMFIGTAFEFERNFSVGVALNYLFGSLIDSRRVVYGPNTTNFFNTLDQRITNVDGFNFDLGFQYFKNIGNNYRIIGAFTASPIDQLNAKQSEIVRNYTGRIGFENFKDTALVRLGESFDVEIYPTYGVGFAIEKKLNWIFNLDYTMHLRNSQATEPGVSFSNNYLINAGFEKYNDISAFGNYFKQVGFRAGAKYNSSLLTIDGEDVQEFGISFGLALPLRKTFSTLNLGIEVGRRGKDESGLTQEDFLNFQLGVTINDKWFIQRKYD